MKTTTAKNGDIFTSNGRGRNRVEAWVKGDGSESFTVGSTYWSATVVAKASKGPVVLTARGGGKNLNECKVRVGIWNMKLRDFAKGL